MDWCRVQNFGTCAKTGWLAFNAGLIDELSFHFNLTITFTTSRFTGIMRSSAVVSQCASALMRRQ